MRNFQVSRPLSSYRRPLLSYWLAFIALVASISVAHAGLAYQSGRISNVTFGQQHLQIILDSGLPDNCAGASYGWMTVPANAKTMQAFVLGLWLRGDASQTSVVVYTNGGIVNGVCIIDQIDPAG